MVAWHTKLGFILGASNIPRNSGSCDTEVFACPAAPACSGDVKKGVERED